MDCYYCQHAQRNEIDTQVIQNRPYRPIILQYGGSLGTLSRHRTHIAEMMKPAADGVRSEQGTELFEKLNEVIDEAKDILKQTKATKDFRAAVMTLNAIVKALELMAKADGTLQPAGSVYLNMNRTTVNNTLNIDAGSDFELAALVGEATAGFSIEEFERLRALTEGQNAPLPVT